MCLRGCAAGPRAGRLGAARCEFPTPSRLPDLTLPAVSPVPIAQGVALIRAVIALSRLTHVAAITRGCRGGLGGRNEGGQSQRGDEQLHGWFHPVTDGPPSVGWCSSARPIGRRLRKGASHRRCRGAVMQVTLQRRFRTIQVYPKDKGDHLLQIAGAVIGRALLARRALRRGKGL